MSFILGAKSMNLIAFCRCPNILGSCATIVTIAEERRPITQRVALCVAAEPSLTQCFQLYIKSLKDILRQELQIKRFLTAEEKMLSIEKMA